MYFEPEKITSKSGRELKIAPIGPDHAEQFLDFMRQVSEDTHFMSRYGDEVGLTDKDITIEKKRQKELFEDERQGMISIFDGERIIGNIAVRNAGKGRKTTHRCSVGLAVRKEYHGEGLGTILMEYAIKFAKSAGYQYMELGVLSDNIKAQGLYQKMGFVEWGRLPEAFILDDGTRIDEITMYKKL
ncbi:Ribosomal protein S18 acetylase RimI [Pseudobutyrivibrio sp. YE44]|uniref:GNAT family N-acetyltransferase n=1 Tax=Pseudobutyrivibrio sp. YE44 TaxID=1520802 RepID=UPI00088273F4|nr:GNAT family N-acetyltransferase [Pseudobutyrivibrio sp. YE44]SDB43104.1 Ribosomal protein S18 acetylase RimI [Pseudobutyrivibrio sp. YE44]